MANVSNSHRHLFIEMEMSDCEDSMPGVRLTLTACFDDALVEVENG
jgi:hypothetical protein